jgi:hypothetical protein
MGLTSDNNYNFNRDRVQGVALYFSFVHYNR